MRSDGRAGYCRPKGLDHTSRIAIFGEAMWYNVPKTADLTKLDGHWRTAILVGRLRSQRCEHIIGMETWPACTQNVAAMEIAHGYRFDTRRSTTQMYQDHLFESRHSSRTGGAGTPASLVCTTSALRFGMRMFFPDEPIEMYLPPGEEEPGYMWQMKGAMYGTRRASRLFPEHTKTGPLGSWLQVSQGWSAGPLLLGDRHDGCSSRRRYHHRR